MVLVFKISLEGISIQNALYMHTFASIIVFFQNKTKKTKKTALRNTPGGGGGPKVA